MNKQKIIAALREIVECAGLTKADVSQLVEREPTIARTSVPYERLEAGWIYAAIRVDIEAGEHVLVLRPFGWHLDGSHIPNAAEQFTAEEICAEHGWNIVCDFGPFIAVIRDPKHEPIGSLTADQLEPSAVVAGRFTANDPQPRYRKIQDSIDRNNEPRTP